MTVFAMSTLSLVMAATAHAQAASCDTTSNSDICQVLSDLQAGSSSAVGTQLTEEEQATLGDLMDKSVYSTQSCQAERAIERDLEGVLTPEAEGCLGVTPQTTDALDAEARGAASPEGLSMGDLSKGTASSSSAANTAITFYRTSQAKMRLADASAGNFNHKTRNFLRMHHCRFETIAGTKDNFPNCQARVWLARSNGSIIRSRAFFGEGGNNTLVGASFPSTAGRAICEFLGGGDIGTSYGIPISHSTLTSSCFYYFPR